MEADHQKPTSLSTPLILVTHEGAGYGVDGERKTSSDGIKREEVVEELKKQIWLAGPLICVSLLQFCLQLISLMFVGHLGELALSGASMATSFATVTGFSLLSEGDGEDEEKAVLAPASLEGVRRSAWWMEFKDGAILRLN
ncbi:hypothetical protein RJ639_014721 [Escallonia herrerae]|uniref:Uncharacterized protein n=1 Tax=Escallonia herrerae TaxID=1293975 RepID=A0AA89AN17_9ASTE|nr:hypothetical protein RJ639_014721 [Escallonia herrerae]